MNRKRRNDLNSAIALLSSAEGIVQRVCDAEEDCVDRVPENLQGTERFEAMEDAVQSLNDALDLFDDLADKLKQAMA